MSEFVDFDFKARHKNTSHMRLKRRVGVRSYLRYSGYLLAVAGLCFGSFIVYNKAAGFVSTAKIFALKQVSVKGYEHVLPMEIIQASGLSMGENIFSVPLKTIRKNIMSIPWINSVSIRKSPPHRIDITVTERKAYCMILLDRLYYVDDHGIIFKQLNENDSTNYPVITGFVFRNPGFMDVQLQPVADAVSFIQELDRNSIVVGKDISELHVDATGYSVITTDGLLIKFGRNELISRIDKLNDLIRHFGDRMQLFSRVDLRFSGMGVFRYKQGVLSGSDGQGHDSHSLTGSTGVANPLKEVNNSAKKG
ncbi:MAG: FtsQ-type POTRA domain-containing protein [Deltaproteobacteria bacterium]|nr:FtsQ-type POTRA domain-containing protein [Deltaproteobacteria bacterium]